MQTISNTYIWRKYVVSLTNVTQAANNKSKQSNTYFIGNIHVNIYYVEALRTH